MYFDSPESKTQKNSIQENQSTLKKSLEFLRGFELSAFSKINYFSG
jgi:hypothetical protein